MATSDKQLIRQLGSCGPAFFGRFGELRDVQRASIPPILAGRNVLVASATASGKTEAVLAPMLSRLLSIEAGTQDKTRLLVLAPTRALVNDLATRLEGPLARLGVSRGRQTSDHRDKQSRPFVLVTTPESLDSMLVRDSILYDGRVVGHLLDGVTGVFIDEAHLFDGSVRGDQLQWLMARLERLRMLNEGDEPASLQVCGGSATVSDPDGTACRLLGADSLAVRVEGTRQIDLWSESPAAGWRRLQLETSLADVVRMLDLASEPEFEAIASARIRAALSAPGQDPLRKALIFVPSRSLCDTLSASLARSLPDWRDIRVLAHHGSLDRVRRESAESEFGKSRDAALVATTTLEVGVDIGDVDLVVLVGAPSGTRSLLQRIGRAGRRLGRTRVLALPRTEIERVALASMLIAARDGVLEEETYAPRWSVFVQQAASFVAQSGQRLRRRSDLLMLADEVWPEETHETASETVNGLVSTGLLTSGRSRLALGEEWADRFDRGGSGMHANFGGGGGSVPVVDGSTGETIAFVAQLPGGDRGLAIGGQVWTGRSVAGEFILSHASTDRAREGFKYSARRGPVGREYAIHVRRGLGFDDGDAPLLIDGGNRYWLHFGGSAFGLILKSMLPGLSPVAGLDGLGFGGAPSRESLTQLSARGDDVRDVIRRSVDGLAGLLDMGRYYSCLPPRVQVRNVESLLDLAGIRAWLAGLRLFDLQPDDPRWHRTRSMIERST